VNLLKFQIITVGKLKEKHLKDGIAEYLKRLQRYAVVEIVEVADEQTPDGASEAEEAQIKAKEAQRIQKYIKEDTYLIALAIEGKMFSSEQLAEKIDSLVVSGKSHVTMVIGGSLGLDDSILKQADLLLSFSKMTFPHQLMRLILVEQLYRSYRIIKGEPYHK
jgi:23S rRNA (pseudouridine1915-N3)-methyltransferase